LRRRNFAFKFSRVPAAVSQRPAAVLELNAKTQPCVSCYLYSCRHYIPLPTTSRGIDHSAFCCNYTIKKIVVWMKLKFFCSSSNIMLIDTRISHSTLYKILNTKTKKYLIHKMLNGTIYFTLFTSLLKKSDKKFKLLLSN